jgi:putative copper export protein
MEFAALLTILGALGFRGIVLTALASRGVSVADAADRARRLGQAAVGLYALAAVIRIYNQSAALSGSENALAIPALRILITGTTWGIGWTAGAIGALLVFTGWKLSKRYGFGLVLVIIGALGLVTAPAMTGHAAATTPMAAAVAVDAVHVAAAGLWVGGLVIVLFAGIPAMLRLPTESKDAAVSNLINSFHPLALLCAPIVVLTGVGSAWLRIPELSMLWTTTYGQTLLYKLAFFLVVLMMGAWNSARVRRRLGSPDATRHVRLTASIELLFAALVVAATTMLVVTPLPTMLGAQ